MDALHVLRLNVILNNNPRRPRNFRNIINPLDIYTDQELIQRFRFNREAILFILELIEDDLKSETARNRPIPPLIKLLIFLRFVATGSYQIVTGDLVNISQASVSRIISKIAHLLSRPAIVQTFIKWPLTQDEIRKNQQEFFTYGHFPMVVGLIDGTHVRILGPTENEETYVNRKGFHSINVQAVCDFNGKFTNIVAKWPGSAADSRILDDSLLNQQYIAGNFRGLVLGDSGYAQKHWLMTPFLNPGNDYEEEYNRCHKKTRCIVERNFGVFKRRFGCLHQELRYHPNRACQIITACAVLHNIAKARNVPLPDDDGAARFMEQDENQIQENQRNIIGMDYRREFARRHFSN